MPQDVSVMSIDGFNLAAIEDVPLTAVHVPRDELGLKRYICYNKDLYVLMQLLVHYFCMGNW